MTGVEDALAAVAVCKEALKNDVFEAFHASLPLLKTEALRASKVTELWSRCIGKVRDAKNNDIIEKKARNVEQKLKLAIADLKPFQEEINNLRSSILAVIASRAEALENLTKVNLPVPYSLQDVVDAENRIEELEILANMQMGAAMDEVNDWLNAHNVALPPPAFTLNLDAALPPVHAPRELVWDASFMKEMTNLAKKQRFNLTVTGIHRISPQVEIEVKRLSLSNLQPLTGRRLLNYLKATGGTLISETEMRLSPAAETDVIDTWKYSSPKAASTSIGKFKASGDWDILRFCYRQNSTGKDIIVLTQDADIRKTIDAFHQRKMFNNVKVYEIQNGQITRAA